MAEVKHIQFAAGWVTDVRYRREGEPRGARAPRAGPLFPRPHHA